MHVKRLYRPSVREALAAAKAELGPDALVLSTELVPAPGWRGWLGHRLVRLTAAQERPVSEARTTVADGRQSGASRDRVGTPTPPPADAARTTPANEPARFSTRPTGHRAGVVARLIASGLDAALAQAIADRMTDGECRGRSEAALSRAIAAELGSVVAGDEAFARYEVFVGPPGAGKTTTIAKIAARERAAGQTLGLVAADAFRAGAIEQLRRYAEIIGSPFRVARSGDELDAALDAARRIALVDTAGRSPADTHLTDLFEVLERKPGVRTHLVLAADTSASAARRIFDRYAPLKPARVVITKLDETDSVTPLLGVVRERGLPVSYLAAGQRVPDDLCRATPANLAAQFLRESALEAQTCH